MRKYVGKQVLKQVICNQCGRKLKVEKGMLKEDVFEGKHFFGYFSKKDGFAAEFDLCENCLEKLLESFIWKATETEQTEFL